MTKTGDFLLFMISFLWAASVSAVTVQANVDSNETSVEQAITLSVSVLSNESVDIESPRLADLDGFRLDNTWDSTSVSQKMVSTPSGMDWETQRRKDFNFALTPMKAGRLSIPALDVKVSGKIYRTQPILVTVLDLNAGGGAGKKRRGQPQAPRNNLPPGFSWPGANSMEDVDRLEEEMFNQLLNRRAPPGAGGGGGGAPSEPQQGLHRRMVDPQFRTLPKNPDEAFFVQVEVDKTEVFEGEQIAVSWYIYTRGQMESLDRVKFPDLKGFWKEIIEEVPSIQFTEEVVNGVAYRKALLASHALFPIKPGTAVIDEYKIKSRVRLPQQGFGLGAANEYTRSSERVSVEVKSLPTENRPQDFAGAVGQFEVQTSVEGQKFPVNQPFNLRVRFEGYGNAKLIDLPAISWPKTIEIYDTKSESKFFKDGRSYKQFDILMIPREKGVLHIPEITVSLFDAATKKYYQKKTAAVDLEISENSQAPVGAVGDSSQNKAVASPEKKLTPQLPPPVAESQISTAWARVTGNPTILGSVYFLMLLSLLLKARNELGWGQRKKSLKELIEKRFVKVDAALKANDHKKVGSDLMNVFYFLLGEATGDGGAVQEIGRLLEKVPPSVRRELGEPLSKAFELYQVLSFAPDEMVSKYVEPETLKKTVKEARALSQKLLSALAAETPPEKS